MLRTTSLCFDSTGLINPKVLYYLTKNDVDAVLLFSDGSAGAFDHMKKFDVSRIGRQSNIDHIRVVKLPSRELRVAGDNDEDSLPHYVYSEDTMIRWLCSEVCFYHVQISISDMTSPSQTQSQLDPDQVKMVLYQAHRLWRLLQVAEDRLCFPAVVLDQLMRYSHSLTPNTIDIKFLQKELGLDTLTYNHLTDLLEVQVGSDSFVVKLSVLNDFYGEYILPLFNKMLGRRLRLKISITDSTGKVTEPMDVTYGELGGIVDDMRSWVKERVIDTSSLIATEDLLAYSKKVDVNDQSCFVFKSNQSLADLLDEVKPELVRYPENHLRDHDDLDEQSEGMVFSHS